MTIYNVSTASQLTTALASAKGGDTITLASGNYGDVTISKSFASDVTITSASATSPAVLHSLTLNSSSHIVLDALAINFVPTATTYSFSPAVTINNSSYITFEHSTVVGGNAITGVSQSATTLDSTGNVLGLPTGQGIQIGKSTNITVDDVEVSKLFKGIVIASSDYVTVEHSDIHDLRTTAIVAGGGNHITIDSNHLHDINPWHWGSGDHADFLAMWTNAGQTTASTDIKITNNLMEQGKGTAVLGMWLQGGDVGYTNVQISGNAILNGNFQGITLWDVNGVSIDHNTLLQTSGSDWKSAPGILLSGGSTKVSVHDNTTGSVNDTSGSTGALANTIGTNTLVQKWLSSDPGYYTNDLILKTEAAYDAIVSGSSSPVVTTPTTPSNPTTPTTPTTPSDPGTTGKAIDGTWAFQTLTGTSGNDTITSKSGGDTLSGGAGNDTYVFTSSNTVVKEAAGGGIDTVIVKGDYTLPANVENLTISTAANNNWSGTGNSLNNVLLGNAGSNLLDGQAGADTINGGLGNDIIIGGAGNDLLYGGGGKDTFRFAPGSGQDTIKDFASGDHDVLDISAYLKAGYKATLTDINATDMKVSFSTGDTIILTGVHAKDLIATTVGFTI